MLNVDTKLFVDPFLLGGSQHAEIKNARNSWEARFSQVIEFLSASRTRSDVAWRTAERLLTFPEVKWTCLGYGAATISGSGSGTSLRAELMTTAKEIVDLGITNPDLFAAMALFEDGMGPDRISDMTCRVIISELFQFNRRILTQLKIPLQTYDWDDAKVNLAANPKLRNQPVVLVPLDILRSLPIATDWYSVSDAAAQNRSLRRRVNADIGDIWAWRTRKEKRKLKQAATRSKQSFETFLDMIDAVEKTPYRYSRDPDGELFWRRLLSSLALTEPLKIEVAGQMTKDKAISVIEKIIAQFQHLIEERRYSSELYRDDGSPRPEKSAQKFFFAVADCYCKANNLDITPEADTGAGSVDFKFSIGYAYRALVEIKLSTNPKLVDGFANQIRAYSAAEDAISSFYVVIDVGHMGKKDEQLYRLKNNWEFEQKGKPKPEIRMIDGKLRPSASKR